MHAHYPINVMYAHYSVDSIEGMHTCDVSSILCKRCLPLYSNRYVLHLPHKMKYAASLHADSSHTIGEHSSARPPPLASRPSSLLLPPPPPSRLLQRVVGKKRKQQLVEDLPGFETAIASRCGGVAQHAPEGLVLGKATNQALARQLPRARGGMGLSFRGEAITG